MRSIISRVELKHRTKTVPYGITCVTYMESLHPRRSVTDGYYDNSLFAGYGILPTFSRFPTCVGRRAITIRTLWRVSGSRVRADTRVLCLYDVLRSKCAFRPLACASFLWIQRSTSALEWFFFRKMYSYFNVENVVDRLSVSSTHDSRVVMFNYIVLKRKKIAFDFFFFFLSERLNSLQGYIWSSKR